MKRHKLRITICLTLLMALSPLMSPLFAFDETQTAWDTNRETHQGKKIAWGPRPRAWLLVGRQLSGDPEPSIFNGNEWYFRYYRDYCLEWLKQHEMTRPPQQ